MTTIITAFNSSAGQFGTAELMTHLAFIGIMAAAVAVVVMCEYVRRYIKTKPKTFVWHSFLAFNYVVYALFGVFVVFNTIAEIFI